VNNLPKVVTQRCLEQGLNPRPADRKPKCLTRCTTKLHGRLNLPNYMTPIKLVPARSLKEIPAFRDTLLLIAFKNSENY